MSFYLDSSAIIKLIIEEKESKALRKALSGPLLTSTLARLEVLRVLDRIDSELDKAGRSRLSELSMIEINQSVLLIAENFRGIPHLRTLDSIHLASALTVRQELEAVVTYDKQMITAANYLGLDTISPA